MGQLSPDGQWRWDGWRWVPAVPAGGPVSADGRWQWNGAQWVPRGVGGRPPARVPTIWTRRLQILLLMVAGLQVVGTLIRAVLLPSEWQVVVTTVTAQWQSQGVPGTEISGLRQTMSAVLAVTIAVTVVFALGFCALQVVGTLRRWVWWYWVQFGFFCLAALGLLLTPLGFASPMMRSELITLPGSLIIGLVEVGAGICMLVAAIRIGPWAMTRDPST